MQHEVVDAAGFEACCKEAPDQCTGAFVGEFLEGTGKVSYAMGTDAELEAQGLTAASVGGLEVRDGRYWRASVEFANPVYFAFKLTDAGGQPVEMASGACQDVSWDEAPPRTSQGQYFIGTSQHYDDEQSARGDGLRDAKAQAVRWLAEAIETGSLKSTSFEGSGAGLSGRVEEEAILETAASGVARFVKDHAWCTDHVSTVEGPQFKLKVAAFLPASEYETAAAEVVGAAR